MVKPQFDITDKLTFNVPAKSSFYIEVFSDEELLEALSWARTNNQHILLLGGGSNILFHKDFDGLVIQISHKGITVLNDDGRYIEVVIGAGENWHEFVLYAIEKANS